MDSDTDRGEESNSETAAFQTIVVVSADPIVSTGISAILSGRGTTLAKLENFQEAATVILGQTPYPDLSNPLSDPILVILHSSPSSPWDELVYQQLQQRTPPVSVLVMGQGADPPPPLPGLSLLWGHCSPDRLQQAVNHLARQDRIWWRDGVLQPMTSLPLETEPGDLGSPQATPRDWLHKSLHKSLQNSLQNWFQASLQAGNSQVQRELQQLQALLATNPDRWIDRQLWQGQQRELKLVQWLLQQGLNWQIPKSQALKSQAQTPHPQTPQDSIPPLPIANPSFSSNAPPPEPPAIPPSSPLGSPTRFQAAEVLRELSPLELERLLFDRVAAKLAVPLLNLTPLPLEIDGLNPHKRRELLILILQALSDRLTELRHSEITPEQLIERQQQILTDLWQETLTRFFGQYTIVPLGEQSMSLVPRLLSYQDSVNTFILSKIPLWLSFLQTLLFQEAVPIDGSPYRCDAPEALNRLEQILENLVLQVANATLQPLFNEGSRVEVIKQAYFHPRLLSTRQIERFRNDLSWKYRVLQNFEEPRNIYESRFALLTIAPGGIHRIAIYAPRQEELTKLTAWQQSLTLGLEFRDALAPRLQSLTRWLGQGVVYVLTHVLGRAIGLVGRGIVQGLGSVWSDRAK